MPGSRINYGQDGGEGKRERERKVEADGDDAREGESRSPRKNRSRNSEAPMHIIDRPRRLIRRTLQFRHRENIASA